MSHIFTDVKDRFYFFVKLLLFASFSANGYEGLESGSNNKSYAQLKPGAAVSFSHNYNGFSELNQSSNVTLTFREGYDLGDLIVTFAVNDGLTINPSRESYIFTMQDTNTHDIHLSLRPVEKGKHYLTIFVSVKNTRQLPLSRVFALAVKAGGNNLARTTEIARKFGVEGDFVRIPVDESAN
ncbi:MAG: hypothetical protein CBC09_03855 [Cellvibrionales bacterium TMED49]|mgnify:FL=1|nr:hypothetical protein [Porticoccaceae bacterium]OUU38955.1 MAG: hypothetical protein CBC09_03855 [Cellvibrionales bacterium TMED49]|tara:strand:+ start:76 stop:621 length:546 start_codon:yes stop_codon:yes gene_type:complete